MPVKVIGEGLRAVTRRIEEETNNADAPLGVLAITHYKRLFEELEPDHVHVFAQGVIQTSGGAELAEELERTGYAEWVSNDEPEDDDLGTFDPFSDTPRKGVVRIFLFFHEAPAWMTTVSSVGALSALSRSSLELMVCSHLRVDKWPPT